MMRAWKIGRFFGIDLYIHWTFLLLPLFAVWSQQENPTVSVPFLLGLITALFTCVVLHEYGHALTARQFGINTRDITLYPIGGVARLERISEKPWEEFWIAVGGPAVNVAIAIILLAILVPLAFVNPNLVLQSNAGQFLMYLLAGNIFLVIFNMVPAFPMDGGRVFRAILSMWLGHLQATRIAATVGMIVAIGGGAALFLWNQNPFTLAVAFFVLLAGQQELRYVEWRHQRQALDDEEALPVIPVRQAYHSGQPQPPALPPQASVPLNGFLFQPRVAVYVWDNENGVWIKEPAPHLPPRLNEN
jgi:Zn-dependent protease